MDFVIREISGNTFTAIASDTGEDYYGERMSVQLYESFRERKDAPPEVVLRMEGGFTQYPYLSIAHYGSGGGKTIAGFVREFWSEDEKLYIRGEFSDNIFGEAMQEKIENEIKKGLPDDERTRLSIMFVDYGHSHPDLNVSWKSGNKPCEVCGGGIYRGKVYEDGFLVHVAFTKKPANERTKILCLEGDMASKKDAEELVGKSLAEELEENAIVERSAEEQKVTIVERKQQEDVDSAEPATEEKSVEVSREVNEPKGEIVEKEETPKTEEVKEVARAEMPTVAPLIERYFALMAEIAALPKEQFYEFTERVYSVMALRAKPEDAVEEKSIPEEQKTVEVEKSKKPKPRQISPVSRTIENEEDYFVKLAKGEIS